MSPTDRKKTVTRWPLGHVALLLIVGLWLAALLPARGAGPASPLPLLGAATLALLLLAGVAQARVARLGALRRRESSASAARSRRLADLSQDLRAPLNGILAYADVLELELTGTRQAGFASAARDCGLRLLGQVEALLELSALEAGDVRLALCEEELDPLLRSALARQRDAAGTPFELACAPGLPARLVCDKSRLLRVLDLLLAHAAWATGAPRLSAAPGPDGILLRIGATAGAAPATGQWQTLDIASVAGAAAGADLAIAADLVALMGGHLWIDGGPGRQPAFSLALPCPAPSPPKPAP